MESEPKQYYDFGLNIGKAAAQIIIGVEEQKKAELLKQQEVDDASQVAKDAAEITAGLLMGAIDADFGDLHSCITDGELIVKDAENAWNDFKSKDIHDITNGLKALGDAAFKIKAALTDCKAIKGDFEKLAQLAASFSNPESVAWHLGKDLIVHGVDIFNEIEAAVAAMEANPRDYYHFGYNVGKAGAQIIIGEEQEAAAWE